jgi:hypothetical protein
MAPVLANPFDPDEFGDIFAEALAPLCDPDTDIDLELDTDSADCFITMCGVDYRVTIVAERVDAPH